MLDNEAELPTEEVTEAPEVEAPEDGEIVVTIEGEEAEADEFADVDSDPDLGEKGKNAIKAARQAAKESLRKTKDLEAKLAAMEAATKPKEPEIKRPSLEDCGFNEDVFAERMAEYIASQEKVKAAREEEASREKAAAEAYQAKLNRYHAERAKVGVDDDAQARVVAVLSPQQQSALMDASEDPAKVVAALAKTPKVLAELSSIKEIHKFAYHLAKIEGKIQVTQKAPPPPETKLRGGGSTVGAISTTPLDKLRDQASATGDYTAYLEEKRRRQAAGVKS
jgi:hypothetical protein